MSDIFKVAGGVLLAMLMLDALAFGAWVISGQVPPDSVYAGAITANIIKVILAL